MSSAPSTSGRFTVRPIDGQNQIYDNVPTDATVRGLKERIFVEQDIAVENQKLIYGPEIMDDSRTLESYHIREGFVIRLLTAVRPPPTPAPTQSAGLDDGERALPTQSARLDDGERALPTQSAELDGGERVLPTVFVWSANGSTVTMREVRLRTTVEEFRKQYSRRQGQDAKFCRLIFSGKELEDVKGARVMTLRDYNVYNECTLQEVFSVPGGYSKCGWSVA